jgi:hypothetical protein
MIMKGKGMPVLEQLGKDELRELVTEVKETVAKGLRKPSTTKKFGAVDMWNRQRRSRLATGFLTKWHYS